MKYIYCPKCGKKLGLKEAGDDGLVPYCTECNQYWFDSFASCVIILVANEYGEMALLTQNYISSVFWTFVAGFIKPGENAEECALREVKEELGLDIERLEYSGTYWFALREQLMHGYIGFVKKKEFEKSIEVDKAIWVPKEDAPKYMFPDINGNTQHILYRKYLDLIKK